MKLIYCQDVGSCSRMYEKIALYIFCQLISANVIISYEFSRGQPGSMAESYETLFVEKDPIKYVIGVQHMNLNSSPRGMSK